MSYVPPPAPSFYDIYANDFSHWNRVPAAANISEEAPAETPRYGIQYPGSDGPSPVFMPPAEGAAFQVPAQVENTSSTDSFTSTEPSPLSSQSPQTDSSSPPAMSFQELAQLSQVHGFSLIGAGDASSTQRKTKKRGAPKRPRGPNRRAKGSGYFDLMRELPEAVQNAIIQEYPDCCEIVKDKDPSTVQKHRFSKRHFNKIDPKYQPLLPAFTCPAYIGLHPECPSAKAGRYDSTERHCNKCKGFAKLQARSLIGPIYPFVITKQEFEAVQKYRKTKRDPDVHDTPEIVLEVLIKVTCFLTGQSYEDIRDASGGSASSSASSSASQLAAPVAEEEDIKVEPSPSPSPPPTDPSPSSQHEELLPLLPKDEEQICGIAEDGGEDSQQQVAAAAASPIDPFGDVNAFVPDGPGFLFGPPYGFYSADTATWPNVTYDDDMPYDPAVFAAFGGPVFHEVDMEEL